MYRETLLVALIGLALALSTTACAAGSTDGTHTSTEGATDLGPLPEFGLDGLDGNPVSSSDLEGKVVLVNFWATWCGPCKIEMPWFVEFQRAYKDQGFTVVAISLDEDGWQPVREFAEEFSFNFPVALGNDELASAFDGVWALPTTFIVDRSGNMLYRHTGLVSKSVYEEQIEALL